MTTTRNIGGRNHVDAEPAFAADFLSFNKGIWGVLARQSRSTSYMNAITRVR